MSRNFMDLSRALKGLADAFHTIKLKLDGLYDTAGALGNKFELIETITLEEAVSIIERNTEPDGTAYNFTDLLITIDATADSTTRTGTIAVNNNLIGYLSALAQDGPRWSYCYILNIKGTMTSFSKYGTAGVGYATGVSTYGQIFTPSPDITSVKLSAGNIPAGTVVKIYAVRK